MPLLYLLNYAILKDLNDLYLTRAANKAKKFSFKKFKTRSLRSSKCSKECKCTRIVCGITLKLRNSDNNTTLMMLCCYIIDHYNVVIIEGLSCSEAPYLKSLKADFSKTACSLSIQLIFHNYH